MQLKKYRRSFFLTSSILLVVSLLFLTINKQQIVIAVYDLNQKIMSADIGVSSFGNLLDTGEGDDDKEVTSSTLKTSIIPLTISLIKS